MLTFNFVCKKCYVKYYQAHGCKKDFLKLLTISIMSTLTAKMKKKKKPSLAVRAWALEHLTLNPQKNSSRAAGQPAGNGNGSVWEWGFWKTAELTLHSTGWAQAQKRGRPPQLPARVPRSQAVRPQVSVLANMFPVSHTDRLGRDTTICRAAVPTSPISWHTYPNY